MRIATLLPVLLAALLAGCGSAMLVPGQSTQSDVRAALGAPTDTRKDRNGDDVWDYAGGQEGPESWRVRIGADGKVKEVTQLVTEDRLLSIVPGSSTRDEVRDVLGRPGEQRVMGVGETWMWRYETAGGLRGHLVVSFNSDGTVRERGTVMDALKYDSDP
jgi:outer membrane protein assembly factor BamE (lipoprotein component of BamABCDE complex)